MYCIMQSSFTFHYSIEGTISSSSSIFSPNKYLEVKLPSSNELLQFNLQWLRDHCRLFFSIPINLMCYQNERFIYFRCSECYNSVTCQRSNDILAFDEILEIANHVQENDTIQVKCNSLKFFF